MEPFGRYVAVLMREGCAVVLWRDNLEELGEAVKHAPKGFRLIDAAQIECKSLEHERGKICGLLKQLSFGMNDGSPMEEGK